MCGMYKITRKNLEDGMIHDSGEEEVFFEIGPLGRDPKP